jgi:hypothetical protein
MGFAVVSLLPQDEGAPDRLDFVNREFESWDEVPGFMAELEAAHPKWRAVTFCHVEDLPLLMESPGGG